MTLTTEQRGVMGGMLAAVASTAVTLIGACLAWPMTGSEEGLAGRLTLFAIAALAPSLTLVASVARMANHRFFTAQDIGGSASPHQTDRAKLLQALLQNTLEQAVLALAAYLGWCSLAPASCLAAAPAAAALFFVGRMLFFVRYESGATARAFGFAVTFYPTVALALGNAYFAVASVLTGAPGS
jgi:hypothetical protein